MQYIIEQFSEKHFDYLDSFFATLSNLTYAPKLTREITEAMLCKIKQQGSRIFIAITPDNEIIGSLTLLVEQKLLR